MLAHLCVNGSSGVRCCYGTRKVAAMSALVLCVHPSFLVIPSSKTSQPKYVHSCVLINVLSSACWCLVCRLVCAKKTKRGGGGEGGGSVPVPVQRRW